MLDLGVVRPGSTIYIPFNTFDSNDPSASVTISGLATTDIEVYKNGSTAQRASDSGYALLDTDGIDFDSTTGIHGISIDLSDNTTAGFYAAGGQYWVVISSITVDAATVNFIAATFRIGYDQAFLNTTIATLSSQTSFTLAAGSADNDAYNGWTAIIHDVASAVQIAIGYVTDYVGSTKTITLGADPGIFTMAATDNISLIPPGSTGAWAGVVVSGSSGGQPNVNVERWNGTSVTGDGDWAADVAPVVPAIGTVTDLGGGATLADNNVDMAGPSFSNATDALEYIRNRLVDVETDTQDIQSRIPAALTGSGYMQVDVLAIDGEANAADGLSRIYQDRILGNADSGSTTTMVDAALTQADDFFNGMYCHFYTGSNAGLGRFVADFDADTDTVTFESALPNAVAVSDAYIFVPWNYPITALATIDANVDTVLADTNELQTNQGDWATATGFSTHSAADVWTATTRVLTANTNLNDPTASAIADAVLDEALSGHVTAGSLGKAVADLETDATAILADTNELQTDDVPGLIAALDTLIDAIKTKTDSLTFTQTGHVDANIKRVADTTVTGAGTEGDPWGP